MEVKKKILRFFIYSVCFSLLTLCEKKWSVTGFCVGFLYALIFCKENPLLCIPGYLIASGFIYFDLFFLIYLASSVIPVLFLMLFHYKFKRKYRMIPSLVATVFSQTAKFFLQPITVEYLILQIIGVALGCLFFYICVIFLYSVLVRGIRYRLSDRENAAAALFISALGAGLYLHIFGVTLFYFVITLCILFCSLYDNKYIVYVLAAGLGASLSVGSGEPILLCVSLVGGYYVFSPIHRFVGALGGFFLFVAVGFLQRVCSLQLIIPVLIATLGALIPTKYLGPLVSYKESVQGQFALRTVINRDRYRIGKKIENVAFAFEKVQSLLAREENVLPQEKDITLYLEKKFCHVCPKNGRCHAQKPYGNGLQNLVRAALDNGRATLLDAGSELGEYCVSLPKLIACTNETLDKLKDIKNKKSEIDVGREMVITELGGTAALLKNLASSVESEFGFDLVSEKKAIEELGYADIVASDVAIYGKGKDGVTITVREEDADKKQLPSVLSAVLGETLLETERKITANGTVSLHFSHAPKYGILYGDASVGKEKEKQSGDARQVIKIGYDKLMFILSDGMGTGEEASKTAACTIGLIESFYRAGFDHKTVFGCVSQLLSLRKKEDFSALDVVIIDTQTGDFDFIKQGGRESYILSENGLETVEGSSLPVGIVDENEPQIYKKHLGGGSIVIMLSDGVADRIHYADVCEFLASVGTSNPQLIAEKLLNFALKKGGKEDDMTVMVARVVKNRMN